MCDICDILENYAGVYIFRQFLRERTKNYRKVGPGLFLNSCSRGGGIFKLEKGARVFFVLDEVELIYQGGSFLD